MNFFRGKVLRVGLLIGLFFVLGESVFRIRAIQRFGETKSIMILDDPVEGRSLQPNFISKGALRTITINEHGFRGENFAEEPSPQIIRIAFLGSSNIFCGGTNSDHQTLPAVLERVLDEHFGDHSLPILPPPPELTLEQVPNEHFDVRKVEVINAGIPGMGTTQVLKHFERRVAKFKPSIAIISFPPNDITVLMRGGVPPKRPFLQTWRTKNSVFYNAVRDKVAAHSPRLDAVKYLQLPEDSESYLMNAYTALVHSCKEHGATPVIMPVVSLLRTDKTAEEQKKVLSGDFFGLGLPGALKAIDLLDSCARTVAQNEHIPFLDVSNSVPAKVEYFEDMIHLNPAGNELLAKAIAQQLIEMGVLEKKK